MLRGYPRASAEVEQVAEKRLLLFVGITPVAVLVVAVTVAAVMIVVMTTCVMPARDRHTCRCRLRLADRFFSGALDQFVELTAIQPHAATCRAIIGFDSLAVRHQ